LSASRQNSEIPGGRASILLGITNSGRPEGGGAVTDAKQIQDSPDLKARIAQQLEDNPDLTEKLIEDILVGVDELNRGESTPYNFS
jgi:hypothetical protein